MGACAVAAAAATFGENHAASARRDLLAAELAKASESGAYTRVPDVWRANEVRKPAIGTGDVAIRPHLMR